MKARVKLAGYIVDVKLHYITPRLKVYTDGLQYYNDDELDFNIEYADPDYWTRLEHQATIAAMQGALANADLLFSLCKDRGDCPVKVVAIEFANACAHALVEKMREEKK